MRWIWIDRFLEFESGRFARAVKNLSLAEDFFADHFPGYPVMPAAFLLEGLAQTGGILIGEVNQFREKVVLAKIQKATFHREIFAGEQVVYETKAQVIRSEGATVSGRVFVEGVVAAEADIFFAHLDQSRSKQLFGERNFVFTGELKNLVDRLMDSARRNSDA